MTKDGDDCVQEPQVGFLEKTKELPEQFGLIAECGTGDGHGVLLSRHHTRTAQGKAMIEKRVVPMGTLGEGEEELSLESSSSPSPDSFIYLNKQYEACLRPSAGQTGLQIKGECGRLARSHTGNTGMPRSRRALRSGSNFSAAVQNCDHGLGSAGTDIGKQRQNAVRGVHAEGVDIRFGKRVRDRGEIPAPYADLRQQRAGAAV